MDGMRMEGGWQGRGVGVAEIGNMRARDMTGKNEGLMARGCRIVISLKVDDEGDSGGRREMEDVRCNAANVRLGGGSVI